MSRRLRVLQVSTFDSFGGAARIASGLHRAYRERGHESWLAVGEKRDDDPDVFSIADRHGLTRLPRSLGKAIDRYLGIEDFRFPASRQILDLAPRSPDVVHVHNLHGGYFDLRALAPLSASTPLVLTLHDAWLLSGHCSHSLDCERWRIGCGRCPDLTLEPPVRRDATAWNWRRKAGIYRRSRLHVATPSRWLMDRVDRSMLVPGIVERRVIPNGVDTSIFHPGDRDSARDVLALPRGARVLLFAGNALRRNVWKDWQTARQAATVLAARLAEGDDPSELLLVALGDAGEGEWLGGAQVRSVPFERDPAVVATWYQAADVYVHASRADTFPNSILEALASGTPVVATAVGGIPEQIDEAETGFLVPAGDAQAMADRLGRLLADDELRRSMGARAAETARRRFPIERQVDCYLDWYAALVAERDDRQQARTAAEG